MIETIDNTIQLVTTAISSGIAIYYAYSSRNHIWIKLSLAIFVYFLGDLYNALYLLFYDRTPHYSVIPYIGWYASYLFLFLLLSDIEAENKITYRYKVLWLVPVFSIGNGLFYMYQSAWASITDPLLHIIVMTLLMWHTIGGILHFRKVPAYAAHKKRLYITILIICFGEYATSIVSCFWMGDTLRNPYFWFDTLLSAAYLLLPAALKKAVANELH